jgi:hypothetical protein
MKYDPQVFLTGDGELNRVLRCAYMAMGCLSPMSQNPDERLAWHRLCDALDGREPSPTMTRHDL